MASMELNGGTLIFNENWQWIVRLWNAIVNHLHSTTLFHDHPPSY
jgi:hypothetical protein